MKKKIFARYPMPNKKEFLKMDSNERDPYIRGRIGDILRSTEIILRERQRIQKAKKCIELTLFSIKDQGLRANLKAIYDDILIGGILKRKNKIKTKK